MWEASGFRKHTKGTPMPKIRFTVEVDYLPDGVRPEVIGEHEGLRYRAMVLRGNAKIVHATMLEPSVEDFSLELPLFILGMTPLRLVRDGNLTPEGERMILGKMRTIVRSSNTARSSTRRDES